jgi:hypothetical protein
VTHTKQPPANPARFIQINNQGQITGKTRFTAAI